METRGRGGTESVSANHAAARLGAWWYYWALKILKTPHNTVQRAPKTASTAGAPNTRHPHYSERAHLSPRYPLAVLHSAPSSSGPEPRDQATEPSHFTPPPLRTHTQTSPVKPAPTLPRRHGTLEAAASSLSSRRMRPALHPLDNSSVLQAAAALHISFPSAHPLSVFVIPSRSSAAAHRRNHRRLARFCPVQPGQ